MGIGPCLSITIIGVLVAAVADAQQVVNSAEYNALKAAGTLSVSPPVQAFATIPAPTLGKSGPERGGGTLCSCWTEPDASYTLAMQPNDDGSSALIDLPFQFSLFGDPYNQVFINNNGNISFQQSFVTYSASGFPSAQFKMIAPFWADVDTRPVNGGRVWYKVTPTAMYVNWVGVGYYAQQTDKLNWFQLIISDGSDPVIPDGNNVSFCYKDMQWTTGNASQGVNGFLGIPATVGVNRGDSVDHAQVGRFNQDSEAYAGPYDPASGVNWLDSTHFYLNTTQAGIPPIFGSAFDCDSIVVQVGDQDQRQLVVIAGEPGQQISATSSSTTLSAFQQSPVVPGAFMEVPFFINATVADLGTHWITFTSTNDASPPLSTTYTLQVHVVDAIITRTPSLLTDRSDWSVFPNPAADQITLKWPMDEAPRTVTVHGLDGRVVLTATVPSGVGQTYIPLQALPPGAYTILAQGLGDMHAFRFVRSSE